MLPLSSGATILQCRLSEEIEFSGERVVVQATAAANDVFQSCGTQSGRRIVSGECVATDETTAIAWIKKQRVLPFFPNSTVNGSRKELPPRISFEPEFVPLTEGIARTGTYGDQGDFTANAKMVRARFSFVELIEEVGLPV